MTTRNPPPNTRQLLILLGIFIAFIIFVIWLLGLVVSSLIGLIPPSVEQKIGEAIAPIYEQQSLPSPAQNTLNSLLDRLENNLPPEQTKNIDYRVLYIPEATVNALAVPGNTIIIYKGLLEQVESENELMMVLGHELGHFAGRDHLRGLGNALVWRLAIAYFFGDIGILQDAIATIANAQYSQSQEKQADQFGLTLLNKTYAQVAGATDFFIRLSKEGNKGIAFLSTHPAPAQRVKELEELIEKQNYRIGETSPLPAALVNLPS